MVDKKETMQENFDLLKKRIYDSLSITDLDYINYELSKIKNPTLSVGVGGSYIVAIFLSKVLEKKNKIISNAFTPRDMLYRGINNYGNVISCSYSGRNYGVDISFDNSLNKYLLSSNPSNNPDVKALTYKATLPKEHSFISLGSTLIPISIILNYYLDKFDIDISEKKYKLKESQVYEIITGYDTLTASSFLESTLVEAGIGVPVIHDKYNLCHGRSTLGYHCDHSVIMFNKGKELDKVILNELGKYYKEVIVLETDIKDDILSDFDLLVQAMYLAKNIAESKQKDLSIVEYSPFVKQLYYFKGEM